MFMRISADFPLFPVRSINCMFFRGVLLSRLAFDNARMRLPAHPKKFARVDIGNLLNTLFFHITDIRV